MKIAGTLPKTPIAPVNPVPEESKQAAPEK
jgi:hypothetical protein